MEFNTFLLSAANSAAHKPSSWGREGGNQSLLIGEGEDSFWELRDRDQRISVHLFLLHGPRGEGYNLLEKFVRDTESNAEPVSRPTWSEAFSFGAFTEGELNCLVEWRSI